MSWKEEIERTLEHEGGYVNDPVDPGGETQFGISKRRYPHLDIKNLTLDIAAHLYKRDYYDVLKCDQFVSARVRWKVFDIGVNMGIGAAAKLLQKAAGVEIDAIIGLATIAAVNAIPPLELVVKLSDLQRHRYLAIIASNPKSGKFRNGWLKRAADLGQGLPEDV